MGLVYSTDQGQLCPDCRQPIKACRCKQNAAQKSAPAFSDGYLRIQRQTQGRGGKTVTTVAGFAISADELKTLAKKLKQICGSGGTISNGVIEIQGDHRTAIKTELERAGFKVKLAGG